MTLNRLNATICVLLMVFQLNIARSQSIALANGFAHNDYLHKHPLFDALQNGYANIEADIFLKSNRLVVAHINPYFKAHRQLENLYFEPLLKQVTENDGVVYKGYDRSVTLMIDIKTEANSTYTALKPLLEKYKSILTRYEDGKVVYGAVTVVLSGHKPYEMMRHEDNRLAFIDEDLRKVTRDTTFSTMYEMASCKYSNMLKWKGNGAISESEQQKLKSYVEMAHLSGEKVRLWASPDNKAVWDELLKCGVDLINTDKLVQLKKFLTSTGANKADVTH